MTKFEPVIWFHHFDHNRTEQFLTIRTETNKSLTVTPSHIVALVHCHNGNLPLLPMSSFRLAARARPGLCLFGVTPSVATERIVEVRKEVKTGIYAPVTNDGNLLVNGLIASCFNTVEMHEAQKALHQQIIHPILKFFRGFVGSEFGQESIQKDIPLVLRLLLSITKIVLPESYIL